MSIAMGNPRISFLISTFNRKAVLLRTLDRIKTCGLSAGEFEILIVDNASDDGTCDSIKRDHPDVRLFPLHVNRGPCAKNTGLKEARGEFVIFLDDDSFPQSGSVSRMIEYFSYDAELGAAVFTITLPDGSRECSAYPDVFIGCGTGFRRSALEQVGGLPEDFFMQAEEYDLSLRLLDAGWRVETFDDIHVTHLKTPGARFNERVTRLDVRNNLRLIYRYFPRNWVFPFAFDWMNRYRIIAGVKGHRIAFLKGLVQGITGWMNLKKRTPIRKEIFEEFTKLAAIENHMRIARDEFGWRRIVFIDFGKNVLPYWLAAKRCGLEVAAIADPTLASAKARYHGVQIVDDETAARLSFDAAIVSNLSPVHAANRTNVWRNLTDRPVIDFFERSASPAHALAA